MLHIKDQAHVSSLYIALEAPSPSFYFVFHSDEPWQTLWKQMQQLGRVKGRNQKSTPKFEKETTSKSKSAWTKVVEEIPMP